MDIVEIVFFTITLITALFTLLVAAFICLPLLFALFDVLSSEHQRQEPLRTKTSKTPTCPAVSSRVRKGATRYGGWRLLLSY